MQVYESKLKELRAKGDPIKLRHDEAASRDGACQALSNACQHNLQWVGSEDPKYAHIEAADRETVQKESASALQWLEASMRAQQALRKSDMPAILTKDILARKQTVENVCSPIINKPAPPPPKEEKPAEEAKPTDDAAAAAGGDTTTAGADGAAPPAGEAPADAEMQEGGTPRADAGAASAAPADGAAAGAPADQAMDES